MRKLAKKKIAEALGIYWRLKLKFLPDGIYCPGKNIKHIAKISEDVYKYPNEEEKKKLEYQTCGIASLKMITDHIGLTRDKSIYEMTQDSLKYETFIIPEIVNKPEDIKGIFHEGLLNYAKSFGLAGFRESIVPLEKVLWNVKDNWLFLASVNIYKLWGGKWKNEKGGLHIVLIVGFEKEKGKISKIFYKDIATKNMWDQETDEVGFKHFKKNFNNRGIFLKIN
jgi:hypothetical protein